MRYWVFTTPPNQFKVMEALIPGTTLDWPTFSHFKFEVGDLVFFYASSPVMQMVGKLEIMRNDLPFVQADPRNDLRKWPRTYSKIPWLRLRVLQCAPMPFKPLERGSLYYHTQFKPSPYPKLLHQGEIDYVLKAFDKAETYQRVVDENPGGISLQALQQAQMDVKFIDTARAFIGSKIILANYNRKDNSFSITLESNTANQLTIICRGIRHILWNHLANTNSISLIRFVQEDIYLKLNFDGAELEVLAEQVTID